MKHFSLSEPDIQSIVLKEIQKARMNQEKEPVCGPEEQYY